MNDDQIVEVPERRQREHRRDAPFRAEVVSAVGIAAFDVIYVRASVAGVIILIGAVLIYLFVAMRAARWSS